jgi:hypothetical protein
MICCAIREAEVQEIGITRHGKLAGMLIGFESEEDWIDDRLYDPCSCAVLNRRAYRLDDLETE